MFKKVGLWRGLTFTFSFLLGLSILTAQLAESYRVQLDTVFQTQSYKIVTEETDNEEDIWSYDSEWTSAKVAHDSLKDFSIREAEESMVLLKNNSNALPISATAKVTLLGVRSVAPVYGGAAGSISDKSTLNTIEECFAEKGFLLNPAMLNTYKEYRDTLTWGRGFGGGAPAFYSELDKYDSVPELSLSELSAINANYQANIAEYDDAAIVVVGRPAGEGKNGFRPGAAGLTSGSTVTGNVLALSDEEMEIINFAKNNFDKVIVLVNSAVQMEIANIKADNEVDAIMWIGLPGSYGFYAVADALSGKVNPSGHLGDIYAKNSALAPALMNHGNDTPWTNAADIIAQGGANINSYLIQAEGIYTGYRYYETRYADTVMTDKADKAAKAKAAKAGTYSNADGTPATANGTWEYANEVVYPFGYGDSYTTFSQTLNSVKVLGNKKTATVSVTVKNTGSKYSGKSVIQVYAQSPYTNYDITNKIEKSAIQLMDFEKTRLLEPGASQTIAMEIDLANLASYDSKNAKTYTLVPGTYYFAIGDSAHDALNNILTAQGYSTGMTAQGNKDKTYDWAWGGEVDKDTFSVSPSGVAITNALTEGDSAMDFNYFQPGTVQYLTRNDWNGTFPKTYTGLAITGALVPLMKNDFVAIKTNEDTSDIIFGDESIELTFADMRDASYDDPRWEELLKKVTVYDFLNFSANAFHNIAAMPSVGLLQYLADDGPLGSDTRKLGQGQYMGTSFEELEGYEEYKDEFTRTAPSPTNLAYTWNKELSYENGQKVLGEVSLIFRAPIMIGAGMNLKRHAYNARGHEYYSEDPILSGYIGSAVVQGAQSKGCVVNIKHFAFNDQEIDRSGVAAFMSEQKAREMELRNLQQAIEAGHGQPVSFKGTDKEYGEGALGIMTSYNRIGAVAGSANKGACVNILRNEWDFKGYSVTDFTSVSMKAAPKESILYGTTAFCGSARNGIEAIVLNDSYSHNWTEPTFAKDRDMLLAIKQNVKYNLYALANSHALNGINKTSHVVQLMTNWRVAYISFIVVASVLTLVALGLYVTSKIITIRKEAQ